MYGSWDSCHCSKATAFSHRSSFGSRRLQQRLMAAFQGSSGIQGTGNETQFFKILNQDEIMLKSDLSILYHYYIMKIPWLNN